MSEDIHVNPDVLLDAAGKHRQVAEYLATVTASHAQIAATLNSLGPIYGDFRRAAAELLDARKDCYDDQSVAHTQMSENLQRAVAMWSENEDAAVNAFRGLTDGPR